LKLPYLTNLRSTGYEIDPAYKPDAPGFDVAVLDTQEFIRGITTPLPATTMEYYLSQGWPVELIVPLFVRQIEFYEKQPDETYVERRAARLVNYPEDVEEFSKFMAVANRISKSCEFTTADTPSSKAYGPVLSPADLRDAKKLAALKTADLVINKLSNDDLAKHQPPLAGEWYQVAKKDPAVAFRLQKTKDGKPCEAFSTAFPDAGKFRIYSMITAHENKTDTGYINFRLRSPEAMLYYLGELSRRTRTDHEPDLFVLRSGEPVGEAAAVTVAYDGKTYWIPAGNAGGQSMHALSLISQVIGLQKKATDLPTSTTVRLVQ
jgi:hypothetical protein